MNIKLRVANLVKKHGTADPFKLARDLDIKILYTQLPGNIRGFLVRVLGKKTIILSIDLCYEAQKITVCHELGHARLHAGYGYFFSEESTYYASNACETEANQYAAYLLSHSSDISPELIDRYLSEKQPSVDELKQVLMQMMI